MATKKSGRKEGFIESTRRQVQEARNRKINNAVDRAVSGSAASKRMQRAEGKLLKGNRFGEPAEMSEAKKARIRAHRAAARKGGK